MNYKNTSLVVSLVLLLLPALSFAAFVPLVGIPQLAGADTLGAYINALYALSISIAALLAVIKIIIAGVKWMLSDVVSSKQQAKSDIQGALLGLLIVISAVLVLGQINPQLVATDLILDKVTTPPINAVTAGGAVIPPAPPKPVLPSDTNLIKCTFDASGTEDCAAAKAQCLADGGELDSLLAGFWTKVNGLVKCNIGERKTLYCPSDDNNGVTPDCTGVTAKCAQPGQILTKLSATAYDCYTPN